MSQSLIQPQPRIQYYTFREGPLHELGDSTHFPFTNIYYFREWATHSPQFFGDKRTELQQILGEHSVHLVDVPLALLSVTVHLFGNGAPQNQN